MSRDLIFSLVLGIAALAGLLAFSTIGVGRAVLVAMAIIGLSYFKSRRTRKWVERQQARKRP